jgi:hypothetical protein
MIPLSQINKISTNARPVTEAHDDDINAEFGRLMHAAVINKHFRDRLLENPIDCIEAGYCGEYFNFPFEIINSLRQINVRSLEEFANHIIALINLPARKEVAPVYCN